LDGRVHLVQRQVRSSAVPGKEEGEVVAVVHAALIVECLPPELGLSFEVIDPDDD
jgi:hypothetical protein